MKLVSISLSNDKIAYVNINRPVKNNKSLNDSIVRNGKIGNPLLLVDRNLVVASGFSLIDPITRDDVTNDTRYQLVALDGQHRIWLALRAIADNKKIQDTVYACVCESKEDLPCEGDIRKSIEDLNISSRNWNGDDFIYSTNARLQGVELVDVIKKLQENKFSLSTISRALAGKQNTITKQSLSQYEPSDADDPLNRIDFRMGLSIIALLTTIGFSVKYLRKRYIYDFVYPSGNVMLARLKSLTSLTKKDIDKIESELKNNDDIQQYLEKQHLYLTNDESCKNILGDYQNQWKDNLATIDAFFNDATKTTEAKNASAEVTEDVKTSESDALNEQTLCSSANADETSASDADNIEVTSTDDATSGAECNSDEVSEVSEDCVETCETTDSYEDSPKESDDSIDAENSSDTESSACQIMTDASDDDTIEGDDGYQHFNILKY